MSIQINRPPAETVERIESAVREALPDCEVSARGMGGHFEIRVVSAAFEGKNTLGRHRLVLGAVAPLMADDGPVHAVDRIEAVTPEEASTPEA